MIFQSLCPEDTLAVAERLAAKEPDRATYYLEGDLGAGKTLFTKGIARHYGIPESEVSSPTFALVQRYGGGRRLIYHLDLYRIEDERELVELGIEELEEEGAVLVVEWSEKMGRFAREDVIRVRFEVTGENTRRITVSEASRGSS